MFHLEKDDPEIAGIIRAEAERLEDTLDLIAAENHMPVSILEALGSVLNTKTIEGYPGNRFHGGCVHADEVERQARTRAQALFCADHANVQPHSGTSANLAVYFSVLDVGDRILSMNLAHGGHLSHGHRASVTSRCFRFTHYGVVGETGLIDYDEVARLAAKTRPRMIVTGASSYPRRIDYARMAEIAKEVSAYLLTDMAHLAGLVAAGVIPSPVPHADFVTFTCYKTMMGGRGGVVLCRDVYAKKVDRAVFPGTQGTSSVSMMAAKAVIFKLAREPGFVRIQKRTLANAKHLASEIQKRGYGIVTGGTENHQILVDVSAKGLSGKEAEEALEAAGMVTNRNVIPKDMETPGRESGIRLGTGAVSARGMEAREMAQIAGWMDQSLINRQRKGVLAGLKDEVSVLCRRFPVPKTL